MDKVKKQITRGKILITGGAGYIGSVLTPYLLENGYAVTVLDRLFFGQKPIKEYLGNPNFKLIKVDIRHAGKEAFKGIETVIHLAGISNDPSCEISPRVTNSINYEGSVKIARLARKMGVRKFIFSSSCSVYGCGASVSLTEESPLFPRSVYARTKIMAERALLKLGDGNFTVTILRNSTIYGLSKKMRFDLAVNLMTLSVFKHKKIYILGGGLQWRPNLHIRDAVKAFLTVMNAPTKKIRGQIFNVGSNAQNYRILELAKIVKGVMPKAEIVNVPSDPDRRDYNVNFDKLARVLGYAVEKNVTDGIIEVWGALRKRRITDNIKTRTLDCYKRHFNENRIF